MSENHNEERRYYVLGDAELDRLMRKAASVGAQTALESLEEGKKKLQHELVDRRLYNTKLLLRNYRVLKENAENSIYGRAQMEESAADILSSMMNLYDDEVIVESIKRSASRTAIMVSHIEHMMEIYKAMCQNSYREVDKRRYQVLHDCYMDDKPMTAKQVARKHHMSKENVYNDIKMGIETLSSLLFGVDSLTIH